MKNIIILGFSLLAVGVAVFLNETPEVPGPVSMLRTPAAAGVNSDVGEESAPSLVVTEAARMDRVFDTVEVHGIAQANESVVLTAQIEDRVRRVNFDEGAYVEVNSILIELTNDDEDALLDESRANLSDAVSQFGRLESLLNRGLEPGSELEVARSRMAAAEAHFDMVRARLGDRLILAPFSGLVGARQVSPGTNVTPSTAITTLDDVSTIKLDVMIPEAYLRDVDTGTVVFAQSGIGAGGRAEGVIQTVNARVDSETREFAARVHLPNDDRALRPGMPLVVRVVTGERTVLIVPESAVSQSGTRAFVFVVDADGIARLRDIDIASRQFGIVEVGGGLNSGERVVTEGFGELRDGTAVR